MFYLRIESVLASAASGASESGSDWSAGSCGADLVPNLGLGQDRSVRSGSIFSKLLFKFKSSISCGQN